MEYMSREDYCEENCGKENREGYKTCKNCGMLNVPSADVQPVKHGQWTRIDDEYGHDYVCSVCNNKNDRKSHYCPDCGARMIKDGDAE